jgi:hypothetical protein
VGQLALLQMSPKNMMVHLGHLAEIWQQQDGDWEVLARKPQD